MKGKLIIRQVENKDSKLEEIDESLYKVCKSICKISYYDEKLKGRRFGSGFFIKLYIDGKELLCIMTNHHVIKEEIIKIKTIINIKYKYEKELIQIKLDEKERYIKYNKAMDFAIVEIKQEEKIKYKIKDKYFLIPNLKNKNLINENIIIVQFPLAGKLSKSEGKIIKINNYHLIYDAGTKNGSSGSPIFLKGTTEVIGMHRGVNEQTKEKVGIKFDSIFQLINSLKKEEILKNENKNISIDNSNIMEGSYFGEFLNNKMHGKGILFDMNGNIIYEGDFVNDYFEGNGKYVYDDGEYYIGQFLKGKKNGKGVLYYADGNIKYKGDFVNNKLEGKGKYIFKNRDYYIERGLINYRLDKEEIYKNCHAIYEGHFVNNLFDGNGEYIFESGIHYIGQFVKGIMQGKGMLIENDDKIIYEGEFANNLCEGKGTYYYENDYYYVGTFVNGVQQGKGTVYSKNGKIIYDGDFVNNKREGNGTYYLENGEYYIGEFKNGLKHGKGILFYKDNNIKYDGEFINNIPEGKGKYIYENGEYYIGHLLKGVKHGKGIDYYKNGSIKFDGYYVNGDKEGDGIYNFENGEYFVGHWLKGEIQGKGTFYYKNGNIKFDGNFVHNNPEGQINYVDEEGNSYLGQFINGKFEGIIFDKNGEIKNNKNIDYEEFKKKKCIIF